MRKLLIGDRIKITSIVERDFEVMEEWFNDVEFMRYYDVLPSVPQTPEEVKKMVLDFSTGNESHIFAIRDKVSGKIIGVTGFYDIIWTNRVATFFIGIADESYKGQGIGKETMGLMLDFGFNELNLHRIQLSVIAYNEGAIALYEGQGFIKEGVSREFLCRDGKRFDLLNYGLLRKEWKKVNQ